ncbi:MAG: potassium channel family protein [Phototrophicaceae bacterium]|jgi:hypothetical protein
MNGMERLKGRMLYFFLLTLGLILLLPISEISQTWALVYVVLYSVTLGFGIYIAAIDRMHFLATAASGLTTAIIGAIWVFQADNMLLSLGNYLSLVLFQTSIIVLLLQFVFRFGERVTTDVIYAAVTVYIMLGTTFTPLNMFIETLTRMTTGGGAWQIHYSPETAISWQQMAYFSFVTLATMGFGDITPITSWGQMASITQGVIGVMYTAILIGRLVGRFETISETR